MFSSELVVGVAVRAGDAALVDWGYEGFTEDCTRQEPEGSDKAGLSELKEPA